MTVTGCYALLLTCDAAVGGKKCSAEWGCRGFEQTYRQAARLARLAGWTIKGRVPSQACYCPRHGGIRHSRRNDAPNDG